MFLVTRSCSNLTKHIDNWEKANAIYYGPERDNKNFPITKQPENRPAVRIGIFPESWFKFFESKTGVTGPYVFGAGMITFMLSKEIWVIEHTFAEFLAFWIAITWLVKKVGPGMAGNLNKLEEDFHKKHWDEPKALAVAQAQDIIEKGDIAIGQQDAQTYLFEAKRENVDLQLEATYRQRLTEVHSAVKKRMDFHLSLENAKRDFEQKHMVGWIVNSVVQGITPQQEKDSIAKCIQDLKGLSVAK